MTLEERIDRIFNAGEIELAGEAYKGKYELSDGKSIKKFIREKLRKIYTNLSTGNKITLSRESANKLSGHLKDGEAYQKSLVHIPEIIENMQFLEEMSPDEDVVNPKFSNYSYYITPVNIDGKPHTILSTVGYKNGEIYYDQNVFKGTPKQTFTKAKTTDNAKYSRLKEILKGYEERQLETDRNRNPEAPTTVENNQEQIPVVTGETLATTEDPNSSTLPEHPISGAIESESSTNKYTKKSPIVQGEV